MPLPQLSDVKSELKALPAKFMAFIADIFKRLLAYLRSNKEARKRLLLGCILFALMLTSLMLFLALRNASSGGSDFGIPDDFGILSAKTSVSQDSPLLPGVNAWKSGYPWRALDLFTEALGGRLAERERIAIYNYCGHIRIALADYAQAAIAFTAAKRIADDAGAEYGLGRIAQLTEDIPRALQFYARAAALRDDFALAWRRQGDCLSAQGMYAEARERYKRAIFHSEDDLVRYRLAECALRLGEIEDAEFRFRSLLESTKNKNIIACSAAHLADRESDKGNVDEAIAYYRQAIRANPGIPAFRYNLGGLYLLQGELDEAVAVYNALLASSGGQGEANTHLAETLSRNLGEVFYDRNDSESAMRFLRGSGQEDHDILSMLGDINFLKGEEEVALEYYRRVLASAPLSKNTFLAYANSGTIYLNRAQPERALAAYTMALEIEPENAQLQYNLGFALLETGDRKEAQAAFLRAYTADTSLTNAILALAVTAGPENAISAILDARDGTGRNNFFIQALLARVFHFAREYGRAAEFARRAIATAPAGTSVLETQLVLLRSLLAQENYSGARGLLAELKEKYSQNSVYLYCAGMLAIRTGDSTAARYFELAREYTSSPSLRAAISYWQGNLAWQEGRLADALTKYREALEYVPGHTAAAYNASYCVRQMTAGRPPKMLTEGGN